MGETVYDWMKAGYTMVPNVFIQHYHKLHLTSDEFVVIVYLLQQINQTQPVSGVLMIANQLGWDNDRLYTTLNNLLDKNYLNIELVPNQEGKQTDHYTLRPLFDHLNDLLRGQTKAGQQDKDALGQGIPFKKQSSPADTKVHQTIRQLIQKFETDFGRVLSSVELETLNQWLNVDHYPVELIQLALREAIVRQAYSFRYIERILANWRADNIETREEAQVAIRNFGRTSQSGPSQVAEKTDSTPTINIPMIKWDNR